MKENEHIEYPALGCKVGKAYQILLSQLAVALADAGLDISTGEYLVLRAVNDNQGLQQCDIAEMIGKDKAMVCRCVADLKKRGFLATESVSHKCLRVFLTEKSKDMMPQILKVAKKRHNSLLAITSPQELIIFNNILDKIIQNKTER